MILTLIIAFLSLIALMIIHEFGHFVIAKKFGVKVEEFGIGYPPRLFGKQFGDTFYSVNMVPLGAFVKIYGEEGGVDDLKSFAKLAMYKRMLIVLGGVMAFWLASMIIFSVVFLIGARVPVGDQDVAGISNTSVQIVAVQKGSPAQVAGLKVGDVISSLQNQNQNLTVNKISDFQKFIESNKGKSLIITAHRKGKEVFLSLTPRLEYPDTEGPTGVVLERVANVIVKSRFYEAPVKGVAYTGQVTWQALEGIYGVASNLFSGKGAPSGAELAGPVGIIIFLARAVDYGPGFFLYFIGSISVLIAIFNLFPIPALDGGKLLFLIIEWARKKPVSVKVEQSLTIIFFILLITMSIFVTIKFDIPRVMEFWKGGF